MDADLENTAKTTIGTAIDTMNGKASFGVTTSGTSQGPSNATRVAPAQVIQNNTFNQVANDLDVKEASRKLGWEVATAI